jgi:hypothetical protein
MSSTNDQTLAGVTLRPQAVELLREIEETYGKPVRVRPASAKELRMESEAAATTSDDGTPEIITFPKHPLTERLIVYQLFNLTYPLARTDIGYILKGTPIDRYVLAELKGHLFDPLEHQQFFPAIRRMGLVPDESLRKHVNHLVSGASLKWFPTLRQPWYLPLYYYAVAVETVDADLIGKLARYYQKKAWHDALKMGMDLVDVAVNAGPDVNSIISTGIECLNVYYEGEARFELRNIKTSMLGNVEGYSVVLAAVPYDS